MEKKAIDRKVENEVERADYTRLKMCMYRAKMGEELTIGFFGGSITQGCSATVPIAYLNGGKRHFRKQNFIM